MSAWRHSDSAFAALLAWAGTCPQTDPLTVTEADLMAEDWYVRDADGTVAGPFVERQISQDLLSGQITDAMHVRQGAGDWCEAARARAIFRQLHSTGWYVRHKDGNVHGPFTDAKLRELFQTGDIDPVSEIRQGLSGAWKSAAMLLGPWQNQRLPVAAAVPESSAATDTSATKWSTEPIRHLRLQLLGTGAANADGLRRSDILASCQPHERLLLEHPLNALAEPDLLCLTRTNGQQVGWLSSKDSRALLANAARGCTHVVLLDKVEQDTTPGEPSQVTVMAVICPPGTAAATCRQYIKHVLSDSTASTMQRMN